MIRRSLARAAVPRFASAAEMAVALAAVAGPLARPVDLDRTVMAARSGAPVEAGFLLDSTTLGTIERRLARYVGPRRRAAWT